MPNHLAAGDSKSVDDFLKAIWVLQQSGERVSTNALAERLGVKAPSVTDMARRMVDAGLVDYVRYKGVMLTPAGEEIALKIIRRHRLLELYLVEELGYNLHEVHEEADNLEHAVSDRFIAAIAAKLNHPTLDPHGDPIPDNDGTIAARELVPLTELPLGVSARVSRLTTSDPHMLQHILDRGLKLGQTIEVTHRDPFSGPLTLNLGDEQALLGYNVAAVIWVEQL
ncbi:MAG: metal-dependent transcriptional regulator [Chloroflexi bacterium]|nr:MAG: metal-dependent transcriptional regulator [Chloroflexota bacterium]